MKMRTEYLPEPAAGPLDPEKPVVLLGSCFTDSIGGRMRECRWNAVPNPCGVLYNPLSIANTLVLALDKDGAEEKIEDSLCERDDLCMSWLSDSGCTTCGRKETITRLSDKVSALRAVLAKAQAVIVTFGTAWIFELRDRPGYVVANCHKFPANMFVRRRISVTETVERWKEMAMQLRAACPEIRLIFTVSPIRHIKDGLEGNSRSKAVLQLACEELCAEIPFAEYFPSYEILNDDLRDYRFYADDLVHPSSSAVEYIWEKFCDRYLTKPSRELLAEGRRITKALSHRPIIPTGCSASGTNTSESGASAACDSPARMKALSNYTAFISRHPGMLRIPSGPADAH